MGTAMPVMTEKQKRNVKEAARELYRAGRISLEMALWAMKNAGYTREATAEWMGLAESTRMDGQMDNSA